MMKLRKTLVTLLVLSMVLAGFTGVAGATFSDTKDNKAANKIEKLAALGVLAGYPDGSFKPDNNITRAEFSKIACVLAGLKSSGDILKNSPSKFSDVPAGEWYTGWVNLAVSQGYMKGYPDGTFKPQANISNAEVLTVLCRLIGYNDNLPGDWPVEYLVKAADLDISKGVTFDGSAPATRGIVCWFAEQSLEVCKVSWDKDAEKFVKEIDKAGDDVTILSENFDESAITEDALCYGWEWSADKRYIYVAFGDGDGGFTGKTKQVRVTDDAVINGAAYYSGLENKIIDYITNDDGHIVYAEVKAYGSLNDTEAEKISATRFKINDKTYNVNDQALVKLSKSAGVFPVADGDVLFGGPEGSAKSRFGYYAKASATGDGVWDTDDGYQKVYALLNDDGEIAYVRSSASGTPGVVDSVNTKTKKITFRDGGNGSQSVTNYNNKITSSSTTYIVFRNGALADVEDIQPGDFLSITDATTGANFANGYDFKLDARNSKVSGELEEYNEGMDSFTIDGKSYDGWATIMVSTDGGDSFDTIDAQTLEDIVGYDVTALTDGNGYIRAIISSEASMDNALYGVVSDVLGSSSGVSGYSVTGIEIFGKDATLHTYAVDSDSNDLAKAKYGNATVGQVTGFATSKMYFDLNDDGVYGNVGAGAAPDDVCAGDKVMVRFTLQSNGAIKKFEILGSTASMLKVKNGDTDLDNVMIDSTWWSAGNAVVFDVSADVEDSDDWEVLTGNDLVEFGKDNATVPANWADVIGFKQSNGEITFIAVDTSISASATYALVMSKGFDADGPYIKVLGSSGSETVKRALDTQGADWSKLAKGVPITYRLAGGTVSGYDVVNGVFQKVYSVKSSGTKRMAIDASDKWFYVDDDTLYWSWTDLSKSPQAVTFSDVQAEDWVIFGTNEGDIKPKAGETIDWIMVVPSNFDTSGKWPK